MSCYVEYNIWLIYTLLTKRVILKWENNTHCNVLQQAANLVQTL